ncbi:zinc finger protein NUTCRACKER-like [Argentina anserina]|uniref:zinc finger protein NUTCRACKER-like n=1 Tax=Argentina anserina TaxID=57926 RepID=UPI0021765CEA|nr:zinc finger protein NUTCRACKER-like [Potentilla anserina]
MLEKISMAQHEDEAINPNGFLQNPVAVLGSNPPPVKKKRNLPGNPDPEAEVIALSPKTLMATNRFLCEICGKGFQRDQNLQLHRRGHNLPWKLKQRSSKEPKKRVYVCPEKSCVHHHASRALGDLTGIKKHFCRKHGEKKWKCEKCSKRYAVQSDWKAHSKTCGTREYKCDCGTLFSRRDSFITHRAFCDALAEETARVNAVSNIHNNAMAGNINYHPYMGNNASSLLLGPPNMSQLQFSSIFKPIPSNDTADAMSQTTRGLSLWMGQGSNGTHEEMTVNNQHHQHQLGSVSSSAGSIFGDPTNISISCSEPTPPSDHYQLNWVLGSNKLSPSNNAHHEDQLTITSVSSAANSLPSLYTHQTPSSNMSATALLQKAAQIGATSTDPTSLLGSFGLKCNNNNTTSQAVTQVQDGSKLCGLYGTVDNPGAHDHLLHMHQAKRRHIQSDDTAGGEQTRDFLGVGVQTICHSSPINRFWV